MKERIFLIIFLLVLALFNVFYFSGFYLSNESGNLDSEKLYLDQNDENIKISNDKVSLECNNFLEGKKSEYLSINKIGLLDNYNSSLDVLNNNEYTNILNLKEGKCELFTGEDRVSCEVLSRKDLSLVDDIDKNSYEYILLKSLVEEKNLCLSIPKDTSDYQTVLKDCITTYSSFKNTTLDDLGDINELDILTSPVITKSKIFVVLGEDKYLSKLKKEFLETCNNNDSDV